MSVMESAHINPSALSALLDAAGQPDSHIANRAGMSAGRLHDLKTGRRYGTDPSVREAIAEVLGYPAAAFECYCDLPARHRDLLAAA